MAASAPFVILAIRSVYPLTGNALTERSATVTTLGSTLAAGGVRRPTAAAARPAAAAAAVLIQAVPGVPRFQDNGGPVIASVQLQLIFWGSTWSTSPSPPVDAVAGAVQGIVSGPYMTGLAQYRGVGPGTLAASVLATTSDPPDPFSNQDVENLLSGLLAAGSLPSPATDAALLFLVIVPAGVKSQENFDGEHSSYDWQGTSVHYGWLTHDGQLDSLTTILSHELVESATDPEGTAIVGVPGTCGTRSGWCEIGDICEDCAQCTGQVGGVKVQAYWSDQDQACIIPGS